MSDENELTSEVARVLGEHYPEQTSYDAGELHGCHCGWEVPRRPSLSMDGDWAAYWAHQAAMLDEAGLLATGEHLAWERGYTWGHNDSQNGTETRNPYPAQIATQEPAGATQGGSGESRASGGLGERLRELAPAARFPSDYARIWACADKADRLENEAEMQRHSARSWRVQAEQARAQVERVRALADKYAQGRGGPTARRIREALDGEVAP